MVRLKQRKIIEIICLALAIFHEANGNSYSFHAFASISSIELEMEFPKSNLLTLS